MNHLPCRILVVVLCVLVLAAAPAQAAKPTVRYFFLNPPSTALGDVQKIAVLDLSGRVGGKVADAMIDGILQRQKVLREVAWDASADPPYFEIIERSRLNAVLGEQRLAEAGIVGETDATELGKLLGVDALVVGSTSEFIDDTYEDKKESYYKNKKEYTRTVRYHTRKAKVTASVRILDATTGKILASLDTEGSTSATETQRANLPDSSAMYETCADHAGRNLAGRLTAGVVSREATLQKVKSKNKQVARSCKEAASLAQANQTEDAWREYTSARKQDPYNASLLHNLGVLHEVITDYDGALELFKAARKINPKDKNLLKAISRVEFEAEAARRAEALGFVLSKKRFSSESANGAVASAGSQTVRVRKKTAPLYGEPRSSAPVLVELPKNMEFEVLKTEGSGKQKFFQVETFDGNAGWLAAADVESL